MERFAALTEKWEQKNLIYMMQRAQRSSANSLIFKMLPFPPFRGHHYIMFRRVMETVLFPFSGG